ncbi:MAG: hydroxymethylbilane synthase, partial [Planctomycetaceae bacterium]
LLHVRPDLEMRHVRGNLPTRLRKLDDREFDALILAEAGLMRLGLADRLSQPLRPPLMFPAVGQGALGVECRSHDEELISLLSPLNDPPTHAAVTAERTLLAELRAGCHAPVGALTTSAGSRIELEAVVLSQDGRERLTALVSGPADDPVSPGRQAADELRRQGAERLITK